MSVKLLLYRVQVLLIELVQVVMILSIPPIRECLLTQTHQRLRQRGQVDHVLALLYVILTTLLLWGLTLCDSCLIVCIVLR